MLNVMIHTNTIPTYTHIHAYIPHTYVHIHIYTHTWYFAKVSTKFMNLNEQFTKFHKLLTNRL